MADNRRSFLAGAAAVLVSASVPAFAMEEEDYSNDFIQTLKARSDAKRNDADGGKVAWKKISNTQKFSQQYERPSFVGVQRKDLTFQMVTPEQLEELKSEGKVIDEYDVKIDKKGKESIDYKKGLIPKFVDWIEARN